MGRKRRPTIDDEPESTVLVEIDHCKGQGEATDRAILTPESPQWECGC